MTITAEVEGLGTLEFPDGTDPAVIQATVKKQLQIGDLRTQPTETAVQPTVQPEDPSGFLGASVIEPAAAITSGLVAEPVAGLAGLAAAPFIGAERSAQLIENVRKAITIEPKTEAGKAGLGTVGDLIQKGVDLVNIPLSGLGAIVELVTGQGVEQASQTIKAIQKEGVGKTAGERVLETTGSPAAATLAATLPTAALARLGVSKRPGGAPDIDPKRAKEIEQTLTAGKAQGVDVLTTDVIPPQTIFGKLTQQFSERVPFIGTGGKRAKQQAQRIKAIESLDQSTPNIQPSDIFASLQTSVKKTKNAAGKRINQVVTDMSELGNVPVINTFARINLAIQTLSKKGRVPNESLIKELENLRTVATDAGGSFETLRGFRTSVREIAEKVDATGRSQLSSADKVLMDRVTSGITKDLDNFVLSNTDKRGLARYKRADAVYRQEALKLTKSRLKTVLDKGDIKPELINNLLFSSAPSEVKLLFQNLGADGRQNARLALVRNALDKATKKGQISPQLFISELDKMSKNFNVFFRGEAKAELQGIKRLFETTERAATSGVITPTGQALQIPATTAVLGGALFAEPVALLTLLSASTIGAAARVYESSGVRNMLIRLGKAPKRSTLAIDLKNSIPILLEQISQGIGQAEQGESNP